MLCARARLNASMVTASRWPFSRFDASYLFVADLHFHIINSAVELSRPIGSIHAKNGSFRPLRIYSTTGAPLLLVAFRVVCGRPRRRREIRTCFLPHSVGIAFLWMVLSRRSKQLTIHLCSGERQDYSQTLEQSLRQRGVGRKNGATAITAPPDTT